MVRMMDSLKKTEIELIDNFFFDFDWDSRLNIFGKIKMPTMIARRVSISVIEAKKILNYFI